MIYNMMFVFTSSGANLDRSINNGVGPPTIRIQGQSCHGIGSLLPLPGYAPKFAQLYIYDTKNEIHNQIQSIENQKNIDTEIVCKLSVMLDEYNVHAKSFRMAKERLLKSMDLKAPDWPNIVSRLFRIKFKELLADLTKKHILGKVVASNTQLLNQIILVEIPSEQDEPKLYNLVKAHMIRGPCGSSNKSSPCMKGGKCSRYYPKKFQNSTIVDQDGYPVYMQRDNGHTILKNGVIVDNRTIVSYNAMLLLKFQAHINMEWCNQSTSIKYLFKYINKGYDRITVATIPTEHQVSSCWRIFFPIYSKKPTIERLFFHLPGEQVVYFKDNKLIDDVLLNPSVTESMFTSWMDANRKYPEAKNLTYTQFVSKFVYVKTRRTWKPRKSGYTIGRLMWVPPSTGKLYFLRLMLIVAKGPCSYEAIKTVGNIEYPTFKEACFAMGFIGDDEEYIEAIREACHWDLVHFLRKLFVTMLLSNSINKPRDVWIKRQIVLTMASSGITSLLLPRGRTAHSKFKILVPTFDDSIFNIHQGSELAELLKVTKLIIWDEAPMAHKFFFETLDKSLRDIMGLGNESSTIFGGNAIVFSGDFRQILSVVPRGTAPTPSLMDQYNNEEYLQCNAILASTIDIVDEINDFVLSLVPGGEKEYLSLDMHLLTPEFLNSLRTFGHPNHKIKLKVGSLIMLLRNIDQSEGLCNGTRLIVTRLANHAIQAKIIDGNKNGNLIYIPRMCMSPS
uniref:ATP-dependent DNA helicase n=1 Tax=Glycine max TaxID=3847 RepID=A0A0R0EYM4_SOYBN